MIEIVPDRNNNKVFLHIEELTEKTRGAIFNALHDIGRDNVTHLRGLIRDKNKTGQIYIIKGKRHQASAPGEAPANLTGNLARSVKYTVKGSSQMEFGETADYAEYLEYDKPAPRIKARPHISRTVKERAKGATLSLTHATNTRVNKL